MNNGQKEFDALHRARSVSLNSITSDSGNSVESFTSADNTMDSGLESFHAEKEDISNGNRNSKYDEIDLINQLHKKMALSGHPLDVSLPEIVVVGCQSAGKSSVLENIAGKEFLPRGDNLVTRRPIVIQLYPSKKEYAVFAHKKDEKFYDFQKVKEEIQAVTNENPRGISKDPINIEIYSRNVLKLTLVDLPGLTQVPDNKKLTADDIEAVREMVLERIKNEKTLILAVSPANTDINNSDGLRIARVVDPKGERTIGVLTKLDIMDQGTNAKAVLENATVTLRRGYVGVVNRSQQDIMDKKDIKYILNNEKEFFENHPCYKHIAFRMGTPYLVRYLHKLLKQHIKDSLGDLRAEISKKMSLVTKDIQRLNEQGCGGDYGKEAYVARLIQQFVNAMELGIYGQSKDVDKNKLSVGCLLHYKLNIELQNQISLVFQPDKKKLTVAIANICALRNSISVPNLSLDGICQDLLEDFKYPLEEFINSLAEIFLLEIGACAEMLRKYSNLKSMLTYRIENYVSKAVEKTTERLKEHIDAEKAFVDLGYEDLDFSGTEEFAPKTGPTKMYGFEPDKNEENKEQKLSYAVKLKPNKNRKDTECGVDGNSSSEATKTMKRTTMTKDILAASQQNLLNLYMNDPGVQQKVIYVSELLKTYLEVIQKQIRHISVQYIIFFLINNVLDFMKHELIPSMLTSPDASSLAQDFEDDLNHKQDLECQLTTLKDALEAIRRF